MPLTVRQDNRKNTATALSTMFFTSHAQVSSSRYVHFAPGRAHGTCATSTPCSGHRTRGAAACRNVRVVPVSTVRHRLVPAPESYPGHGRRHCPHRPADRASGRTDTTRTSSSPSGSTWTVTSSMTMPWTPNSCPNTLALRMPCPSPSFRSLSKTKTTAGRGMSPQNRWSGTHYNVTRANYGFRPGRSCQDAIQAIYMTCKGSRAKRVWALDADLAAAFDKIDHDRLLEALGSFPARDLIQGWLKAGVFEVGKGFAPTEEGTPQGGVISPLLLNVALHGLAEAAGVRYVTSGAQAGNTKPGSPVVIRYADDLVALCHSYEEAQQVQARLAEWLTPRGLTFNQDKTRVVPLDDGFDFLGATRGRTA